ncbi:hypothetical protein [Mangrovibacterium marinum]|uniref:Uncharacterized protein n=1 Tax=Mangrovibacterium marinum TaxID=1639118 RepID=A0A2T5BZB3_9BACT|nr:hypothetical protein [Mangrovibacterium marinum]PTN07609.1 hypothetical protein C8N47_11548 [Mangrovibacterium marinum]
MKKNKTKRPIGISQIAGIIVGVAVAIFVQQFFFTTATFEETLSETASEINQTCPIMVDSETRLDSTMAMPDHCFAYNYTLVNLERDTIDAEAFARYMTPVLADHIKTSPDMKSFREHQLSLTYTYKDRNGVFITRITITPDMYS